MNQLAKNKMNFKRNTKIDASFSMSSMSDIVFLLLIFFLVTSTLVNPNALKLLLPKSSNQISEKATVSISIQALPDNTYSYHINGEQKAIPFNQIEERLQDLLKDRESPTFAIYADKSVPIENVVNIMNIAKHNKYKVILATSPE